MEQGVCELSRTGDRSTAASDSARGALDLHSIKVDGDHMEECASSLFGSVVHIDTSAHQAQALASAPAVHAPSTRGSRDVDGGPTDDSTHRQSPRQLGTAKGSSSALNKSSRRSFAAEQPPRGPDRSVSLSGRTGSSASSNLPSLADDWNFDASWTSAVDGVEPRKYNPEKDIVLRLETIGEWETRVRMACDGSDAVPDCTLQRSCVHACVHACMHQIPLAA